ncbi:MAG: hypothetical protein IKD55_09410 [Sediminibacterium sp.]|nr:hypothetical protein [Sediminibacterium sp.]MBX9781259.1 hypothetical protein [Chitinophagaceae bacterium]
MQQPPIYVYLTFIVTVLVAYFIMIKAAGFKKIFMVVIAIWIALQVLISLTGFYTNFKAMPPRFSLLLLPPLLSLVYTISTKKGSAFLRSFDLKILTIFHIIRIPVELVLYWLFLHKAIPDLMTFEGRNFDIVSGLTAPLVYYFAFIKKRVGRTALILWNIICLLLVINVVVTSILSFPTSFQQLAFDQPNIGILYAPFILLPSFLVPMVILSHASSIKQLLNKTSI